MIALEPLWVTNLRHSLVRLESFIAGSCLLLLLGLVFGEVLARNFFSTSIPAADILSRYLVLYVTFFGAALAVESHQHIRLDVVAACLSTERTSKLRAPLYLISAILCLLFTWAAIRFWYDDWQYVSAQERWSSILALVIPLGFALLSLHFLIGGLFKPRKDDSGQ